MKHLDQLRARVKTLDTLMEAFLAKVDKGDALTPAEIAENDAHVTEMESLISQIRSIEGASRARGLALSNAERAPATPKKVEVDPTKAFDTLGTFLQAVAKDAMNGSRDRDPRLVWERATGASEAVPSEGGFLVQNDISLELFNLMHEQGEVIGRCRRIPLSANSNGIKLPTIDETSRANGSRWGGVRAYWADEGDTVTASKPKLGAIDLKLNKLMALGYATDELLADAAAMEAIFRMAFLEELLFKVEDGVIRGSGAGQMLGLLNSGALISVTPDSGQPATQIRSDNVLNMMNRLAPRSRRNAVWLINQDLEPQLWKLQMGTDGAATLLYRPPGVTSDASGSALGTLLSRPVIPIEQAASIGTVGDIMLVDLSNYLTIDKGGMNWQQSMHVRFIYDEMTFKVTYRVDGQPAWKQPLTPANGSNTVSPFVALGTR